jgi:hypothetical protein
MHRKYKRLKLGSDQAQESLSAVSVCMSKLRLYTVRVYVCINALTRTQCG